MCRRAKALKAVRRRPRAPPEGILAKVFSKCAALDRRFPPRKYLSRPAGHVPGTPQALTHVAGPPASASRIIHSQSWPTSGQCERHQLGPRMTCEPSRGRDTIQRTGAIQQALQPEGAIVGHWLLISVTKPSESTTFTAPKTNQFRDDLSLLTRRQKTGKEKSSACNRVKNFSDLIKATIEVPAWLVDR